MVSLTLPDKRDNKEEKIMNINEFYNEKVSPHMNRCIGYSFIPAPAGDNTPKQSLAQNLTRMCKAANSYISTMRGEVNAKEAAATDYAQTVYTRAPAEGYAQTVYTFDTDYTVLAPVKPPGAIDVPGFDPRGLDDDQKDSNDDTPTSSGRSQNLNADSRGNGKTPSPKKKSKKSFKPTTVPVNNDHTTSSRRSASPSSANAKPKKDRTQHPTTIQILGQQLKALNKDIYYDFDGASGDNIRIFFCSNKLTGANINARADALKQPDLLENLRVYFNTKFCMLRPDQIDRYYNKHKSKKGAFFLHVLPPSKDTDLHRALHKMGLPSADTVHAQKKTIKVPKPRPRQKSPGNGQK